MPWDTYLIPEQRTAASYYGAHARLLAGPGTGKTLVMARRMMFLIEERKIDPAHILGLTFTRAAALELRQRVAKEVGEGQTPKISTLHSFALRQLLRNSKKLSALPQPLRIADDWEERHIIQEDVKRILGLERIDDAQELFHQLSADWESLVAEEKLTPDPRFIGAWRENRTIFGFTLRSELVYQLKRALEQLSDFELEYPIRYLLVDEYQDLNKCDLAVIKAIAKRGIEVFIAGDDDQSIYLFRKAHPEGIRSFPADYENSASLPLSVCKRCDPSILEIAEFVAELDTQRIPKQIVADAGKPLGEVRLLNFKNQEEEASAIAAICKDLVENKMPENENLKPGDILVLARTDWRGAFSRELERAFASAGVALATGDKSRSLLDSDHGRQVLAFLRLLRNPEDHLAWRTLLATRRNGLAPMALSVLYGFARNNGFTFIEAMKRISTVGGSARFEAAFSAEYEEISQTLAALQTLAESAGGAAGDLGTMLGQLTDSVLAAPGERAELLPVLLEIAHRSQATSIGELSIAVEASDDRMEQDVDPEKINFLTMHKAKGLTAEVVFIMAAEDEHIPGKYYKEPELGDERRLLYVSLTRAKHRVFITYCNERTGQQRMLGRNAGDSRRSLTQFLRDSPLRPSP